jgi:Leucine-rich repeat (LRR) protein
MDINYICENSYCNLNKLELTDEKFEDFLKKCKEDPLLIMYITDLDLRCNKITSIDLDVIIKLFLSLKTIKLDINTIIQNKDMLPDSVKLFYDD